MFEDLHWADPGMLDFIDHLLECRNVPIVIVTLARPELVEPGPAGAPASVTFLALDPSCLRGTMRDLLAGLVADLPGLPCADRGACRRRPPVRRRDRPDARRRWPARLEKTAGYRPVGDLGELAVPDTLHALIAARLDTFEPRQVPPPGRGRAGSVLHRRRAGGRVGYRRPRSSSHGSEHSSAVSCSAGDRPAVSGARAVCIRPGVDPRGGVLHAGTPGPPEPTPCRRPIFRGAGRRGAGRRARGPVRRGVTRIDRGRRGGGASCSRRGWRSARRRSRGAAGLNRRRP